jgi:uncharacterized protein (TIGR02145 family)
MHYAGQEGIQGFCPPGWHIPTEQEWSVLFAFFSADSTNAIAGRYLKSSGTSGFNALLGEVVHFNKSWNWNRQYLYYDEPLYNNTRQLHTPLQATFFWSSTPSGPLKAWSHGMNSVTLKFNLEFTPSVSYYSAFRANAFFVRCIHD